MAVVVRLEPHQAAAAPLQPAEFEVSVHNAGVVVEEYVLEVLGPVAPWSRITPDRLALMPGSSGTARLALNPPTRGPLAPGAHVFGVRAAGAADHEAVAVAEGVVEIDVVSALEVDLSPRTSTSRTGRHEVTVTNLGNAEARVHVQAEPVDIDVELLVRPAELVVPVGGAVTASLSARTTDRRAGRAPFRVTARSFQGVSASVEGAHAPHARRRLPMLLGIAAAAALVLAVLALRGGSDSKALTDGVEIEAESATTTALAGGPPASDATGTTAAAPGPPPMAAGGAGPAAAPAPGAPAAAGGGPGASAAPGPGPGPPPPPAVLSAPGSIDLGAVDAPKSAGIPLRNTGPQAITFTSQANVTGLTVSPSSGSINPGQVANVTVTLNPTGLREGPQSFAVAFAGSGGSQTTQVRGTVRRPPTIQGEYESGSPCTGAWELRAGASDETGVATLTVSGTAGSNPFSASLNHLGSGFWITTIGTSAGHSPATVTYTLTATDTLGMQASKSRTFDC